MTAEAEGLSLPADAIPQDRFVWTCETEIDPSANTSLEGLYLSNGMYCTQCEAEGFRKITYYPDRPDVMTRFHVRIEADKTTPILLSNGNPEASGDLDGDRHLDLVSKWYAFGTLTGSTVRVHRGFDGGRIKVDRGRCHLIADRQNREDRLDRARRAKQMPGGGFR